MEHGPCLGTIIQTKNTGYNIFQNFRDMNCAAPATITDAGIRNKISQIDLKCFTELLNRTFQNDTTFWHGSLKNCQIVLAGKGNYQFDVFGRSTKPTVEIFWANRFILPGSNTPYKIPDGCFSSDFDHHFDYFIKGSNSYIFAGRKLPETSRKFYAGIKFRRWI